MASEQFKAIQNRIFLLYFVPDLQSAHKMWGESKTKIMRRILWKTSTGSNCRAESEQ